MEVKKEGESSTKKDWMVSPRLSFSHDIPQTQLLPSFSSSSSSSSSHESNVFPPVITDVFDFDFTTSLEISTQEPCSADELFSDGKILPLPLKPKPQSVTTTTTSTSTSASASTRTNAKQNTTLKEIIDDEDNDEEKVDQQKKETERKPFWMFGRSGSVGSNRTTSIATTATSISTTKQKNNNNICPFRRSRSAGYSTVKTRNKNYSNYNYKNTFRPMESNSKIYYYSGMKSWSHGDGVRINPVINLPRGGSTASSRSNGSNSSFTSSNKSNNSSLFGYLLCKCSTKRMEKEMERRGVTCSP
ncbi:hypothetical protein IHE45_17G090000 [Dioscorea alata]|uniref:Uncharacterized protein n=1 Tax=Dioscorea alata TaxID=55571 RepID=A0ACB7UDU2_DIOAL|nr:hypothetical protein IHE45_17G090000 [Dioscorea alata]